MRVDIIQNTKVIFFTITYSFDYTKIDLDKLKEPGLNLRDDKTLSYSTRGTHKGVSRKNNSKFPKFNGRKIDLFSPFF